jgi:murein DD-endopeptidase MepM/ murein hydrolase activator NlpD
MQYLLKFLLLLGGLVTQFAGTAQTYGPYFRWPLAQKAPVNSYFDHDRTRNFVLSRTDHNITGNYISLNDCLPNLQTACYDHHEGLDIQATYGVAFYAVAGGTIICTTATSNGASRISIRHNNGFITDYLHYQRLSNNPRTGAAWRINDAINENEQIGEVGDVGAPGAPHLHFGVRVPVTTDCDYTWGNFRDPLGKLNEYPSFFKTGTIVDETDIGFIAMRPHNVVWQNRTEGNNNNSFSTPTNEKVENDYDAGLWLGTIPQNGFYKVQAYIPSYPNATVSYKIYSIDHNSKSPMASDKEINQGSYRNQWADLGTYYFETNKQAFVLVTDMQGNNNSQNIMAFDAVKWEYISASPNSSPPTNANSYVSGNQNSINPVVPPARTHVYSAPSSISTLYNAGNTAVNVPIGSTLIFSAGNTVTINAGFYAQGTLEIFVPRVIFYPGQQPNPSPEAVVAAPAAPALTTLQVFPNPTRGVFTLSYRSPQACNKVSIIIRDAKGTILQTLQRSMAKDALLNETFHLEKYPAGIYLLELSDCEKLQVQKIIKQ